jgi:hypothetical protein
MKAVMFRTREIANCAMYESSTKQRNNRCSWSLHCIQCFHLQHVTQGAYLCITQQRWSMRFLVTGPNIHGGCSSLLNIWCALSIIRRCW